MDELLLTDEEISRAMETTPRWCDHSLSGTWKADEAERAIAQAQLSKVKAEIENMENPFEGYIDVVENIRIAKSYGFEKLKQDILRLLGEK